MDRIKILFLDIDGVLNNDRLITDLYVYRKTLYNKGLKTERRKSDYFSEECIEYLNAIVRQTECKIVISSSWRNCYILDDIRRFMIDSGFIYPCSIIDKTDNNWNKYTYNEPWFDKNKILFKIHHFLTFKLKILEYHPKWYYDNRMARGYEIQEWLDNHPEVYKFVILDDENDMLHLEKYLVKTETKDGLTLEKTIQVINKLK